MLTDAEKAALERAAGWLDGARTVWPPGGLKRDAATLRGLIERAGWQPIETAPMDDRFLVAIKVRHITGREWWEHHVVWLDDETGDIAIEADQGWALSDYHGWQPLPTPPTDVKGDV